MLTQAQIITALDEELGDAASLITDSELTRWFNDGQARIGHYRVTLTELAWDAADKTIELPADYVGVERISYPDGVYDDGWELGGPNLLVLADPAGARAAGTVDLFYRSYWPDVTAVVASAMPRVGDSACISYVLHRFYKKLASNRVLFKRYATLVGANAVSVDDLLDAASGHYDDYIAGREDFPAESASTFGGR